MILRKRGDTANENKGHQITVSGELNLEGTVGLS
jgi:hypothetical protein